MLKLFQNIINFSYTSHKILKLLVKNLVKISLSGHNSTQDNAEASRFEFAIGQHNSFAFATQQGNIWKKHGKALITLFLIFP